MRVITFNAQATEAIHGRSGNKLRLDMKDGTLFIRPTDRKAGPHVLTEMAKGKDSVTVEITDKQLEKLGAENVLAKDAVYSLVGDKYGWFGLRSGEDLGEQMVDGSEAKVSFKTEAKVEEKTEEKTEEPTAE